MTVRREKAEATSAQIEFLLEQEYSRGWSDAMKYFAKESVETDQINRNHGDINSIREGEGETT